MILWVKSRSRREKVDCFTSRALQVSLLAIRVLDLIRVEVRIFNAEALAMSPFKRCVLGTSSTLSFNSVQYDFETRTLERRREIVPDHVMAANRPPSFLHLHAFSTVFLQLYHFQSDIFPDLDLSLIHFCVDTFSVTDVQFVPRYQSRLNFTRLNRVELKNHEWLAILIF